MAGSILPLMTTKVLMPARRGAASARHSKMTASIIKLPRRLRNLPSGVGLPFFFFFLGSDTFSSVLLNAASSAACLSTLLIPFYQPITCANTSPILSWITRSALLSALVALMLINTSFFPWK